MRTFATINPLFWTRGSGKRLRGHPEAQIVALYLMTCPQSSMVGIYVLNLGTLTAETGLTIEGARKGLRKCAEEHVAFYDEDQELVWVPALSHHQVGRTLSIGKNGKPDKRIAGILKALKPFAGHRFVDAYLDRYGDCYSLHHPSVEGSLKPLLKPSPFEGAYDPDPDPVSDPVTDPDPPDQVGIPDMPEPLRERAQHVLRDPLRATFDPKPEDWPEVRAVFATQREVWGGRPVEVHAGLNDPRLRVVVERLAEGFTVERLQEALRGSKLADTIRSKREFQTLQTILRDAGQVEKFAGLLDEPGEDHPSGVHQTKPKRWVDPDAIDPAKVVPPPPELREALRRFGTV